MSWTRWQKFLRTIPARIVGSRVELDRYHAVRPPSWALFPEDFKLMLKQAAARDLIGDREVVADRILIEDQPVSFVKPIDFDGLPNG